TQCICGRSLRLSPESGLQPDGHSRNARVLERRRDQGKVSKKPWTNGVRMNRNLSVIGVLFIATGALLFTRSFAQGSPQPDAQRGAAIVASGTDYGVVACARCHAFDGAADGSGAFPKLSGISAYYLAKQLRDFASGSRADAIMSAIARKMKPEDIMDVSEYYAVVRGTPTPVPPATPDLLALGTRLATIGDQEKEIQAC